MKSWQVCKKCARWSYLAVCKMLITTSAKKPAWSLTSQKAAQIALRCVLISWKRLMKHAICSHLLKKKKDTEEVGKLGEGGGWILPQVPYVWDHTHTYLPSWMTCSIYNYIQEQCAPAWKLMSAFQPCRTSFMETSISLCTSPFNKYCSVLFYFKNWHA